MSYYLSIVDSLNERKASHIFFFKGLSVYLLNNKVETYLFDVPGIMKETPISMVIDYVKEKELSEAEILLPSFDKPLVDKTFEFIANYLEENDVSIGLLVDDESFIESYEDLINKYGITYVEQNAAPYMIYREPSPKRKMRFNMEMCCATPDGNERPVLRKEMAREQVVRTDLDMDEPFADILVKLLIESGKSNSEVYSKGGITRQVFSKILCNKDSVPRKDTVICLIIGLELNYEDAKRLLRVAGYALSRSIVFDSVVMKYLRRNIFDIDIINIELNERGCPLLGWKPRDY